MNTIYTTTSTAIYDSPIHYDNVRLHESGSVVVFSQFQVHYYDVVYEPRNLYNISWFVIRNGKDTNTGNQPTTKEEWLMQRHQRDFGLYILNVEWLNQKSSDNYSLIQLSNKCFMILKKAYENEAPGNYVCDNHNIFLNRQQIMYDSTAHSEVGLASSIRTASIGNDMCVVMTAHEGLIQIWQVYHSSTRTETNLIPLFSFATTLSVSWFDWINPRPASDPLLNINNISCNSAVFLVYDSYHGQFERHFIDLPTNITSVNESSHRGAKKNDAHYKNTLNSISTGFGNNSFAGLKIQQIYFFELHDRLLLLTDSKVLTIDLQPQSTSSTIQTIHHDHLQNQTLLCLNLNNVYTFDPSDTSIYRWRINSEVDRVTVSVVNQYVGNSSFRRLLGARTDPLNCSLILSGMIPPTDNTREGQINANLVHTHLEFSVVALLPISVGNNETMIQSLQQLMKTPNPFPVTAIYFPFFIQRLIDYRKERCLDIVIPRVNPKQREAYEFGLQHDVGARFRKHEDGDEDDDEEEMEVEEGDDDEDLEDEVEDFTSDSEIELDDKGEPLTKKSKKNSSSSGKKANKSISSSAKKKGTNKKKDNSTDGNDFVMNTLYQQLKANFGLDSGKEYTSIITIMVEAIKREIRDIKPLPSSATIIELLELLTDPRIKESRLYLWKLLHMIVCTMIKFNRLPIDHYPWIGNLRRRIAEPIIQRLIERGELVQEEHCQVCQTLLYLDLNNFQEITCPGCENSFDRCCFSLKIVDVLEEYKMCPTCGALGDASMATKHIYCPFCDVQLLSPWYQ